MLNKVLIIIPTYNEYQNIISLLKSVDIQRQNLKAKYEISILNVDDNSPDGTARLAAALELPNFFSISNPEKIGLGPAYIAGFNWGLAKDFDFFVEMDADGSHLPEELIDLLESAKKYDLVIGTRWMPEGTILNWPWYRRLISKLGTFYAAKVLRLEYRDLTSGYRVLNRNFLRSINLTDISTKGYGFQIEIAFQAFVNGFSIAEVPITFVEREHGRSKMTLGIALEAFKFVSVLGIRRWVMGVIRR